MKILVSRLKAEPELRNESSRELVEGIPEIPESLVERAASAAFERLAFEERDSESNVWEYHCSRCGASWSDSCVPELAMCPDVVRAKHNERVYCPECGVTATKKIVSRCGKMLNLDMWASVLFLVRVSAGRVYGIRGSLRRVYSGGAWKDDLIGFAPIAVHVWQPGKTVSFLVDAVHDKEITDFRTRYKEASKGCSIGQNLGDDPGGGYVVGTEQLDGTFLQYSCLDKVCEEGSLTDGGVVRGYAQAVRWLSAYSASPRIEFLAKVPELRWLLRETVLAGKPRSELLDWKGKTPEAFFRVTKAEAKAIISGSASSELTRRLGDRQVEYYHSKGESSQELMKRLELRKKLRERYPDATIFDVDEARGLIGNYRMEKFFRIADAAAGMMSFRQVMNYAERQRANFADYYVGISERVIVAWSDYLDMAENLGCDLSDRVRLAPKNLREAHDTAVATSNAIKERKLIEMGKERKKLLESLYSWTDGEILIRPPKDMAEIMAEGQTLHHCVGGYAERHVMGKVTILFVRSCGAPDVPLYTMELSVGEPWKLIQIHGLRNCDPDEITMKKVDKWLAAKGRPEREKTS